METNQKVAVVTGSGQGLGRAIALKLAKDGYAVALFGRTEERLQATAKEIEAAGGKCILRTLDVSDWDAVQQAFLDTKEELGGVDVLVNNAGGWAGTPIEDIDPQEIHSLMHSIVLSTTFCSKAAIPLMRERGAGFILNIGSTSGLQSTTDAAAASAPKAAVDIFTKTLALEVEKYHIRVAVVHPGNMDKAAPDAVPQPDENGRHTLIGYAQVADVVAYIVEQPANVAIQEVVVTPANELR
jgi:NADP-dependent 3-hydroxy acid dehydrogenase YdfG